MADHVDQWAAKGHEEYLWYSVKVVEMESRPSAAGTVPRLSARPHEHLHRIPGPALMIPNMYKIAAVSRLTVFHVSARTVASAVAEHLW